MKFCEKCNKEVPVGITFQKVKDNSVVCNGKAANCLLCGESIQDKDLKEFNLDIRRKMRNILKDTKLKNESFNINKVLFEGAYPILFTLIDEDQKHYLAVCCDHNAKEIRWLIIKLEPQIIIDVLRDKITLNDAFMWDNGEKYEVIMRNKTVNFFEKGLSWDKKSLDRLPTHGEYLDGEAGEFVDEIKYFEQFP